MKTFIFILSILFCNIDNSQHVESINSSNYMITVKSDSNGLLLNCETGCNQKTLKIPFQTGDQIAISNTGSSTFFDFTDFDRDKEGVFLFYISLDGDTYKLKSFVGSRWEELSFQMTMSEKGILTNKGIKVKSGKK